MKTYRFVVKGKVQGVYYRKNICTSALKEGFVGYVRNLPNKDVEAICNLDTSNFNSFISILEKGSVDSVVDEITKEEMEYQEFKDFEIRY